MSTWAVRTVRCPCGHTQEAQLADGLHITRLPEVRERILAGTFHHAACAACKRISVAETKTLYTDFDRHHWVAVAPPWLLGDWAAWADVVAREFHHNMEVAAPPMVRELAPLFRVRLVFGLDALAEKLTAWDAGLDDVIVEAAKIRLHAALRGEFPPGTRLRLTNVDRERWTWSFRARGPSSRIDIDTSLDGYLLAERHLGDMPEAVTATPFGGFDRVFAGSLAALTDPNRHMHVVEPPRPFDDDARMWPRPGYPAPTDD